MYKEANTTYLHINTDLLELNETIHCQNQHRSTCILYQLQDALVVDDNLAMSICVMDELVTSHYLPPICISI